MIRVVVDTNVLISGTIHSKGFSYKIAKMWEGGELILVTSLAMLEEAERVFNYPRIKKKYHFNSSQMEKVFSNLAKYSVVVRDLPSLSVIERDPEDNIVISTAIAGKADYIVTGDGDLLDLGSHQGIEIVTPRRLCEIIKQE
ncbi:MAG: putative toxin-antitoxin system toxin component, PIN family [Deltaproteobacteria bacterium]|nr:putative toxin-antitoxin system toxin component, PIN family [Deltaproteobacteria bacterium]